MHSEKASSGGALASIADLVKSVADAISEFFVDLIGVSANRALSSIFIVIRVSKAASLIHASFHSEDVSLDNRMDANNDCYAFPFFKD